jgi:hypothetical protein
LSWIFESLTTTTPPTLHQPLKFLENYFEIQKNPLSLLFQTAEVPQGLKRYNNLKLQILWQERLKSEICRCVTVSSRRSQRV